MSSRASLALPSLTVSFAASLLLSLALPATALAVPQLYMPWPCDVTYSVTQGHNGGSHTGMGAWAWDFGIPVGAAVVAPADGVIRRIRMDSTTGGCSSSYANDANYVVVDFGDGSEALLLHLQQNSSSLRVGDSVRRGDVVGRIGLTGWVCGAHLHFQIQQTCSSWWCQSIPANFVDFADPSLSTQIKSNNCGPAPVCNAKLNGGTTLVDERDSACFERVTSYWWSVSEGYDNHHYFTYGTDAAAVETWGRWHVDVEVGGRYRVEAHIPSTEASSQNAVYVVHSGTGAHRTRAVNQSTQKGWQDLGSFDFAVGTERYVQLDDNTGESYDLRRKLAYDAIRFVYVVPDPEPEPIDEPEPVDEPELAEIVENVEIVEIVENVDENDFVEAMPDVSPDEQDLWPIDADEDGDSWADRDDDLFVGDLSQPDVAEARVEASEVDVITQVGVCGCQLASPRSQAPAALLLGLALALLAARRRSR